MGVGSVSSSSREGRGKQRKGEAGKRMGDDGGEVEGRCGR